MTTAKTTKSGANATKTIKLLANERDLIKEIREGLKGLENDALNALEKSINVGRKISYLRDLWDDRLKALYKEVGTDWKSFVQSTTGKEYSWTNKLKTAANIADSKAAIYQSFLADAKTLGYPVSVEGLISFASGTKKGNKTKSEPADLIRYSGLEIKFREGKFELAKGNKAQVQGLIKFLKGIEKNI